jgi:titin
VPQGFRVYWTDRDDAEDGFELHRSFSSSFSTPLIVNLSADTEEWIDTNIVQGQKHYYRVRAYNEGGNSPWSIVCWLKAF